MKLKPSQGLTAIALGGAALSGATAAFGNPFIGLIIADVVLVAEAVAPYLASIGD